MVGLSEKVWYNSFNVALDHEDPADCCVLPNEIQAAVVTGGQ